MDRWIKRAIILLLVFFAGRWGVERFMEFVDARYAAREELAREIGEKKGAQIQRTIDAGNASRADALRQQLGTDGSALQGVGTTPPVSGAALRRQIDAAGSAAQSRAAEAGAPR